MASILFVMKYPLHRQENLQVKFDGQISAARALGHEVYAIGWDSKGMWLLGKDEKTLLRKNRLTAMPGYDHTKIFVDLMASVQAVLKRIKIDLLYLRYMPTFGNAVAAIRQLKRQGGTLVMEFPTFPREQENQRSALRRPVFAYTDWVLQRIHPMVDLYTVIGQDCGGSIDGRPAMNIVNGMDVEKVPLHVPRRDAKDLRLLALASMAGWHGYDRILRSLADYRGSRVVRLHMVGADGDGSLAKWKSLSEELGLSGMVTFHGALYQEDLNRIVAESDVGIGSLGMFRYGLNHGMTLKLREFMARGLPFVYAVDDPSLPENERFCLRVDNSEADIDMERVVAFGEQARQSEELPRLMRAYAEKHMSWKSVWTGILAKVKL